MTYKLYEVIHKDRLINYTWYGVNPLKSIGNMRQNHWTMNNGQRHDRMHGCIAAAALKGTVKPVLRGHPRRYAQIGCLRQVPLNTGSFAPYFGSKDPKKVAAKGRLPLNTETR